MLAKATTSQVLEARRIWDGQVNRNTKMWRARLIEVFLKSSSGNTLEDPESSSCALRHPHRSLAQSRVEGWSGLCLRTGVKADPVARQLAEAGTFHHLGAQVT